MQDEKEMSVKVRHGERAKLQEGNKTLEVFAPLVCHQRRGSTSFKAGEDVERGVFSMAFGVSSAEVEGVRKKESKGIYIPPSARLTSPYLSLLLSLGSDDRRPPTPYSHACEVVRQVCVPLTLCAFPPSSW